MMRVGVEKCRGCQGSELVVDYEAGDVACRACGLVDGWQLLDERPAFEDQVTNFAVVWGDATSRNKRLKLLAASSSGGKQRAGDAAAFAALASGRSGGSGDAPRTSKRCLEAGDAVRSAGSALRLNACLVDAALKRLGALDAAGRLPYRAGPLLGCASLYHACKENGVPRTLDELSGGCGLPKADVGRAHAAMRKEEEAVAAEAAGALAALAAAHPSRGGARPGPRASPAPPPPPLSSLVVDEFRVDFGRAPPPGSAAAQGSISAARACVPPPPPVSAPETVAVLPPPVSAPEAAGAAADALWAAGEVSAGDLGLDLPYHDGDRGQDDDPSLASSDWGVGAKRSHAEDGEEEEQEEAEPIWEPRDSPTDVARYAAEQEKERAEAADQERAEAAERARALAALVVLPEQLVPRLCSVLALPPSVQILAVAVAQQLVACGVLEGRPPQLQAAACLHLCHFLFPRCSVDAASIAAVCHVSALQLAKAHRLLAPHWPQLLPLDTQRKVGAATLNDLLRV
jgi:transcription initiation factor TFIIIB Brf1 subunit/transcription initiation factor TFIIB